jgi:hypothetical protein
MIAPDECGGKGFRDRQHRQNRRFLSQVPQGAAFLTAGITVSLGQS